MISTFEASILGFVSNRPSSRYDVMKSFQTASIFWSGSPGSVYIAIDRLEKKGFLLAEGSTRTKIYEVTDKGLEALKSFLQVPVPAAKLFVERSSLKVKLRGLDRLSTEEQLNFCSRQLKEFEIAKELIERRRDHRGIKEISQELADLTLAQLRLEENFIKRLAEQQKR